MQTKRHVPWMEETVSTKLHRILGLPLVKLARERQTCGRKPDTATRILMILAEARVCALMDTPSRRMSWMDRLSKTDARSNLTCVTEKGFTGTVQKTEIG